jgi:hypothetical protein
VLIVACVCIVATFNPSKASSRALMELSTSEETQIKGLSTDTLRKME